MPPACRRESQIWASKEVGSGEYMSQATKKNTNLWLVTAEKPRGNYQFVAGYSLPMEWSGQQKSPTCLFAPKMVFPKSLKSRNTGSETIILLTSPLRTIDSGSKTPRGWEPQPPLRSMKTKGGKERGTDACQQCGWLVCFFRLPFCGGPHSLSVCPFGFPLQPHPCAHVESSVFHQMDVSESFVLFTGAQANQKHKKKNAQYSALRPEAQA